MSSVNPWVMSDLEPPIIQPWLRIEYEQRRAFLWPEEGSPVCEVLRARKDNPFAQQLVAVLDSAITTLAASPLHAGTRSVRVAADEVPLLLEAAKNLEQTPFDRYAKLQLEFGGDS
jgi:hypothetical protein